MVATIKLHGPENARRSFTIGIEGEEALFRSLDFEDDKSLNAALKSLQDTENCAWSIAEISTDSRLRYFGVLYSVKSGESVGITIAFADRDELDVHIKDWTSSRMFASAIGARIRTTGDCERP